MAKKNYLITGGAGFIGSNYVSRLLERGESVTIYDNLNRAGAKMNMAWLDQTFGRKNFRLVIGDIRDVGLISQEVQQADVIVHLAAQVAVTTSVVEPRNDFEINALGTFNVLEAARLSERNPIVLYASTNKVYGGMEDVEVMETGTRWQYRDLVNGCPESQPLDFHSPYGCSKGAGDQYARDYHRIYGLRTVVFRQSCIYGPRQFGVEDQGWLAWMIIAAITGQQITIYGDGKQVRDVLYVNDLLDIYDLAVDRINIAAGAVYNVGGGPDNVISVWYEFGPMLENLLGHPVPVMSDDWRPGDQRVFYADIGKASAALGWTPKTTYQQGIEQLYRWVKENKNMMPQS
jgi:CDP-paratose 2-epimerase